MPFGTINVDSVVNSDGITSGGAYGFKNRILNGQMVIDQRNAGASVTPNSTYTLDRWICPTTQTSKFTVQQNAGSVTPPTGFSNYLGVTSSSSYSVNSTDVFAVRQIIEGFNSADLAWGTASALPITISFWVRSSLTGTFGLGLGNSGFSRAYPATYTINSANTWEYKTVTIAGDTSGTWLTTNGTGIQVSFGLGYGSSYLGTANAWNAGTAFMPTGATSVVGTNGATFYITGVQLEKGSTATSFDYRPYGTELQLCQRYFAKLTPYSANPYTTWGAGFLWATTSCNLYIKYPTTMRASPTLGYSGNIWVASASNYTITGVNNTYPGLDSANWQPSGISGATIGHGCVLMSANDASAFVTLSSEL